MAILKRRQNKGTVYIAIDPGLTGAVAAISSRTGFIGVEDMPTMANGKGNSKIKMMVNPAALLEILVGWEVLGEHCLVGLERIASMPGQGVASMFSMGDTFGCCRSVVAVWGMQMVVITPQQWKKYYSIVKDEKKEIARAKAIQLYPQASLARKKDHNRAEAILLAHYLMEKYTYGQGR